MSSKAGGGGGDSGGPLLVGEDVAGITSTVEILADKYKRYFNNAEALSYYVPLQSAFAQQFLANAIAGGAKITFTDDAP